MKRIRFSSFEIIAFDFINLNCVSRNDTFLSNSFLICGFHQCSLMTLASISKPSCLSHRYLIKHGLSVGGFQSLFPKSSGKPVIKIITVYWFNFACTISKQTQKFVILTAYPQMKDSIDPFDLPLMH